MERRGSSPNRRPLELTGERTLPGIPEENYWFRRHEAAYRFALRWAAGSVLDVGCGEGYGAAMLAEVAGATMALELDPDAAAHVAATYPSVRVVRGDACRLPFHGRSFDLMAALQGVE